jgi:hypothetical protein
LDQSFVSPWTCLSLMAIQEALGDPSLKFYTRDAIKRFVNFKRGESGVDDKDKIYSQALKTAEEIDESRCGSV